MVKMNLHEKAVLAIPTGAMNVNFVSWHLIVLAVSKGSSFGRSVETDSSARAICLATMIVMCSKWLSLICRSKTAFRKTSCAGDGISIFLTKASY